MTTSHAPHSRPTGAPGTETASAGGKPLLFDLAGIDMSGRILSRDDIAKYNPHRGEMALLDWIVWQSEDLRRGVALKHVRDDEFWVPGHFPERPLMPGVLMLEAGAQLASYLYNARFPEPRIAAFIGIDDASFRNPVSPGQDLLLLCEEIRFTPRRFSSRIQGASGGKLAFEAQITGMTL
ncbi:MAG: beta-hydroxyacyl-ACP dehydratase [Phycisphaeraceae bacterium]|nr:beta-hydroxyacyl-ACP dehydratase [Phycisphaeraceae bacterium]